MAIPVTRPVIGEDLDSVRDKLGLSTGEACWVFAQSITKWTQLVRQNAKQPLRNPTVALLARMLDKHPDLSPLPRMPAADEVFEMLRSVDPDVDKKRLSVYFGCEASSGYRWITLQSEISPAIQRLMLVFKTMFQRARAEGVSEAQRMLEEWREMVEREAMERNIHGVFATATWIPAAGAENDGITRSPTLGLELDALRDKLGLGTMDACWLYGMSMTKWGEVAKGRLSREPLPIPLALLVRVLRKHPDMSPIKAAPSADEVFDAVQEINPLVDRKRIAVMFGCEASSGYRWLTTKGKLGPALVRLMRVYLAHYELVRHSQRKSLAMLNEWDQIVEDEARARGLQFVFNSGCWNPDKEDAEKIERRLLREAKRAKEAKKLRRAAKAEGGAPTGIQAAGAHPVQDQQPVAKRRGRPPKAQATITAIEQSAAAPGTVARKRVKKQPALTPVGALAKSVKADKRRVARAAQTS